MHWLKRIYVHLITCLIHFTSLRSVSANVLSENQTFLQPAEVLENLINAPATGLDIVLIVPQDTAYFRSTDRETQSHTTTSLLDSTLTSLNTSVDVTTEIIPQTAHTTAASLASAGSQTTTPFPGTTYVPHEEHDTPTPLSVGNTTTGVQARLLTTHSLHSTTELGPTAPVLPLFQTSNAEERNPDSTTNVGMDITTERGAINIVVLSELLLTYILRNHQDTRIALITYDTSDARVFYDSITPESNNTDICHVLTLINSSEQPNETGDLTENYASDLNVTYVVAKALQLTDHIMASSEVTRTKIAWFIYDDAYAENVTSQQNDTEVPMVLSSLRNASVFLFSAQINIDQATPDFILYQTYFNDAGTWMDLFQANTEMVDLGCGMQSTTSTLLEARQHTAGASTGTADETPTPGVGTEVSTRSTADELTTMGNNVATFRSTMNSFHQTTGLDVDRDTAGPSTGFTTMNVETTAIEIVDNGTRKPITEHAYFWIIIGVLASVILIMLCGTYFLTIVVCWKKDKKSVIGHKYRHQEGGGLEEVYMEGYKVPVPSTGSGRESSRSFSLTKPSLFETDSITEENHIDMPGWDGYLLKQLREHNLLHLSVSCFSPKRGAWTPGFEITERQIRDIERIYKNQIKPAGNCIELAVCSYKLDKRGSKFGKDIMHASRVVSCEEEHVWISFGGGYCVIGVSELDDSASDRCLNCVLAIQMHILASSPQTRLHNETAPRFSNPRPASYPSHE